MNFFRFMLLAAAIYLLVRMVRAMRPNRRPVNAPPPRPNAATYEPMARCAGCGAHSPQASLNAAGLCTHCRE